MCHPTKSYGYSYQYWQRVKREALNSARFAEAVEKARRRLALPGSRLIAEHTSATERSVVGRGTLERVTEPTVFRTESPRNSNREYTEEM